MEILPSNQVQAPDDEEDQLDLEDGDNCISEEIAFQEPAQETLFTYCHQHFEQPQNITGKSLDAHLPRAAAISTASGNGKPQSERLLQEGFGLASPKLKAKTRKAEIIEVHGGRIIRSTGRKDRHSKVCTAKGTRDRRVRLSPKTAILFFDVQDRLGYDRPSKAIDWLMKEAKAAIDALDEPPPPASNNHFTATNVAEIHGPPNSKNQQMQQDSDRFLKTERGMIQNLEHLNDDNPISSFGFFTEVAAPLSSTEYQDSVLCPRYQEQFLSAPSAIPSEIFDANLDIARLQRIFSWNYANARGAGEDYSSVSSLPLHFPAPVDLDHSHYMFSQREPLQSSHSRITNNYSPQFPGISFSNVELPNFTAAASFNEDEMDIVPVSSKSSSTASFLHFEE